MGHPRRPASTRSVSSKHSVDEELTASKSTICSDDVKREHNLRVLKRRDPSALAILETFEFVTIYRYVLPQEEWEKTGVDGCLFLYERNQFPPYGLFLLNRNGMNDYTQWIQPGDDISPAVAGHSDFAAIKFYPAWSNQRLERLFDEHRHEPHVFNNKFSPLYALPNKIPSELKGEGTAVGFWSYLEPGRELSQVMARFHRHAQLNTPFPDEYRYGPGRLSPRSPYRDDSQSIEVTLQPPTHTHAPGIQTLSELVAERPQPAAPPAPPAPAPAPTANAVDQLFAHFLTPAPAKPAPTPTPNPKITMQTLFDSVSSQPAPRTATPKVLDQGVISSLLGLTPNPSRSQSSTPSSHSLEADNEESEPDSFLSPPATRRGGDVTPRAPDVKPPQAAHVPLNANSAGRPLVPFQDESSLWPYSSTESSGTSGTEEEIIELDFSDMRALSDPRTYAKDANENGHIVDDNEPGKKKKRNKRKERDALERAQIEQSWDSPTPVPPHVSPPRVTPNGINRQAAADAVLAQNVHGLQRSEFIRELLTLIHTDKTFVDQLWKDYQIRQNSM